MRLRGAPVARVTSCVFIVALSPYYSRSASHRLTHGSMWSMRSTVSPPEGLFRLGEDRRISFAFFVSGLRLFRTRGPRPGYDQAPDGSTSGLPCVRHGGPALRPQPSHSPQQLIQCDRQLADADARRMIDSVGNRSGGADDPDFSSALRAHWVDMQILLVDPVQVDRDDMGSGRDMVLREVMVHVIAEARVQDARLVQCHRQAHGHPAQQLRAGCLRIDDATNGKDPQQPWDTHLTRVRVDADLGELRAKGMHGELLRLGVRVKCAAGLQPPGRDTPAVLLAQPCAQRARCIEDRPPPRAGTRRASGHERLWQAAITDLKAHALHRPLQPARPAL